MATDTADSGRSTQTHDMQTVHFCQPDTGCFAALPSHSHPSFTRIRVRRWLCADRTISVTATVSTVGIRAIATLVSGSTAVCRARAHSIGTMAIASLAAGWTVTCTAPAVKHFITAMSSQAVGSTDDSREREPRCSHAEINTPDYTRTTGQHTVQMHKHAAH